MILVLFGTNRYPFGRLVRAVEDLAAGIPDEIVAQTGFTDARPRGIRCIPFLPREDLLALIGRADVVIAHGGFATLGDCLRLGKKIVAVPRRNDLGENGDPGLGQEEVVRRFEKEGLLVGCYDTGRLAEAWEKARAMQPGQRFSSEIPRLVLEYVWGVWGHPSPAVRRSQKE